MFEPHYNFASLADKVGVTDSFYMGKLIKYLQWVYMYKCKVPGVYPISHYIPVSLLDFALPYI